MTSRISRREFLKRTAAVSILGTAGGFATNLATMSAAAAADTGGYRALVCLFLFGGNDHHNLIVPTDPDAYAEYATARSSIALTSDALTATDLGPVSAQGDRSFALHPSLAGVRRLYLEGNAAVVANVGPLIVPTTLADYRARAVPLPPKLRSHNDQQSAWQAHVAGGEGTRYGWGGRLADGLVSRNTATAFTAISVNGNAVWLSGLAVEQYHVSPTGALSLNPAAKQLYGSAKSAAAYRALVTGDRSHLLEQELSSTTARSLRTNAQLRATLPAAGSLVPAVPAGNPLAAQLSIVARMIAARTSLGLNRQVFLVGLGGFDTHDALLAGQAALLGRLDTAVVAFWEWLGQLGLQSDVVLFTASDFGRTLTGNGDGSDHGWGAHHLVIGGGVNGGTIHGEMPPSTYGTTADVGAGVLLPTLSVDQYAAAFGRWLGVAEDDLDLALPNLRNFDRTALSLLP